MNYKTGQNDTEIREDAYDQITISVKEILPSDFAILKFNDETNSVDCWLTLHLCIDGFEKPVLTNVSLVTCNNVLWALDGVQFTDNGIFEVKPGSQIDLPFITTLDIDSKSYLYLKEDYEHHNTCNLKLFAADVLHHCTLHLTVVSKALDQSGVNRKTHIELNGAICSPKFYWGTDSPMKNQVVENADDSAGYFKLNIVF